MSNQTKDLAISIANVLEEKKGSNIKILDVSKLTVITDYFVIVSAGSDIQVRALREHVEEQMAEAGIEPARRENYRNARWVVLDYVDVIVHIFYHEQRDFYDLERLWSEAPIVEYQEMH